MTALDLALVASRLLQYGGVAGFGGAALFFLQGRDAEPPGWLTSLLLVSALAGGFGALGWLMAQAGQLGDGPAAALDATTVFEVATGTSFGRAALARAGLLLAGAGALCAFSDGRRWAAAAGFGLAAAVSFAWTGHGASAGGPLHLMADVVHLVAATVWLGALIALLALALTVRAGRAAALSAGMRRFSAVGVAVVVALVLSGLVNSWVLVGPDGAGSLASGAYGRLLLAKLAAFAGMVLCAAWNRYRHTPALSAPEPAPGALAAARTALLVETILGALVISLVSALGVLPPPAA